MNVPGSSTVGRRASDSLLLTRAAGDDRPASSRYLALIVTDAACRVKFCFWGVDHAEGAQRFLSEDRTRLRAEIEAVVARAIADVGPSRAFDKRIVLLDERRAVHLSRLVSDGETLFALIIEPDRNRDSISRAINRFKLTRRQTEVLVLVLHGASAGEIADLLSISEYTAQGYIKTLLSKTDSRNRPAMVGKILDWHGTRSVAGRTREDAPDYQPRGSIRGSA
ncbi:MAG: LuxR C-terminal-related transcriptional regulator [Candidatus Baltobacteraceae bacterium]